MGCARAKEDVTGSALKAYDFGINKDNWDEARPYARAYLLEHPRDAGVHYLWGQCHLHGPAPWLEIARGEFLTALHELEETGDPGILRDSWTRETLVVMCHREIARSCFREIHHAAQLQATLDDIRPALEFGLKHVKEALKLAADDKELLDMQQELERMLGSAGHRDPAQPAAPPAGALTV